MNIIEEKWDSVVDTLSTEFGFSPISINTWIKPLQVQRYDSALPVHPGVPKHQPPSLND